MRWIVAKDKEKERHNTMLHNAHITAVLMACYIMLGLCTE